MGTELSFNLFTALEGVRFVYGSRLVLTLRPGFYSGNGRGAIQVESNEGPYCVLTVNVPEVELAEDETLVRTGADKHTDFVAVRATIANSGFWEATGRNVDQGFVENYATVWRFRRCALPAKPADEPHKIGDYAVLCPACVSDVRERYEAEIEALLARDAAARLTRGRADDD